MATRTVFIDPPLFIISGYQQPTYPQTGTAKRHKVPKSKLWEQFRSGHIPIDKHSQGPKTKPLVDCCLECAKRIGRLPRLECEGVHDDKCSYCNEKEYRQCVPVSLSFGKPNMTMSDYWQIPQEFILAFNQLVELLNECTDVQRNKPPRGLWLRLRLHQYQKNWNHRVETHIRRMNLEYYGHPSLDGLTDANTQKMLLLVVDGLTRLNDNFEHYLELKRYKASRPLSPI